jgi:hypothetical protein
MEDVLGQVARHDPSMQLHTKIWTWYRARTKLPKGLACCNYTKTERLPLALPARVELEVGGGGAGHTVGVKTPRLTSQAPGFVCQLDLSFAVHAA